MRESRETEVKSCFGSYLQEEQVRVLEKVSAKESESNELRQAQDRKHASFNSFMVEYNTEMAVIYERVNNLNKLFSNRIKSDENPDGFLRKDFAYLACFDNDELDAELKSDELTMEKETRVELCKASVIDDRVKAFLQAQQILLKKMLAEGSAEQSSPEHSNEAALEEVKKEVPQSHREQDLLPVSEPV